LAYGGANSSPFSVPLHGRSWRAQQDDPVRRIGGLVAYAEGGPKMKARVTSFHQALETLGWSEGRNLLFDSWFAP
jgi:hypothetical protein